MYTITLSRHLQHDCRVDMDPLMDHKFEKKKENPPPQKNMSEVAPPAAASRLLQRSSGAGGEGKGRGAWRDMFVSSDLLLRSSASPHPEGELSHHL